MTQIKTAKMQKTHFEKDGTRYFWNVSVKGEGTGEYRSRHSTSQGVKREFMKNGKSVTSVTAKMK